MRSAAAVALLLVTAVAQAHSGHAVGSFRHLATEPDHLAALLLPVAIAAAVVSFLRRRRRRRARSQAR